MILQPYDMEVGAGTFHPATTLHHLGNRMTSGIVPMCSLQDAPQMVVMAKIQTVCSTITNIRS